LPIVEGGDGGLGLSQPVVADVQWVDVMTRAAMPPFTPTGHKQRKIINANSHAVGAWNRSAGICAYTV
jgi:hypothetical protein